MSIHEPFAIRSPAEEQPQDCIAGAPYRFTVEQFHQMIDGGILGEDDRIELLEGGVLQMSPKGPRHVFVVQELSARLATLLPADWHLRAQDPLTLADSEPEPDLAIVRDYAARHPSAGEVGLVIEVADASLELDRGVKQRIYATAGIPLYWLVSLQTLNIEVFSQPLPPSGLNPASYQAHRVIDAQGAIAFELAGKELGEIRVGDLLPAAG